MSIRSFKHRGLNKLWKDNDQSEISAKDADKIRRILSVLNSARSKKEMNYPGSGFHPIEPKEEHFFAMKVDKRFRITFKWDEKEGHAWEVNFENYH
ncbi:MAG: type II toxin-antitoxin system RelE/ParE family toxin [Syntrophobacteraceae bacterium]|nr:type II toxin-antitoxin system RelE/ParE family toxin [Syntrophobacteraceae bacterium]